MKLNWKEISTTHFESDCERFFIKDNTLFVKVGSKSETVENNKDLSVLKEIADTYFSLLNRIEIETIVDINMVFIDITTRKVSLLDDDIGNYGKQIDIDKFILIYKGKNV